MKPTIADTVISMLKEGLSLWKVFLSTRQEAYERKMDNKKQKAIDIAEEGFEHVDELIVWIYRNSEIPKDKLQTFDNLTKKFYKYKDKFNKYD